MKDTKLTLLQYNVQKSQSVQELLLATSALQEVDIFYFILFYSYTDLAVEPCRTSRYMFVSPENLWRNKNWSLGETRENLVEYAVAKEICTCSYLLKQTVDLVELRKRVGGLG